MAEPVTGPNGSDGSGPAGHRHEPGPLGEEAARLLGAAQDWLQRGLADAPLATGAPEGAWCPLCQLVAVLRGDRPEVAARLAETQLALAGLLRAVADAVRPAAADPGPATSPPPPRVQRIRLEQAGAGPDRHDSGQDND